MADEQAWRPPGDAPRPAPRPAPRYGEYAPSGPGGAEQGWAAPGPQGQRPQGPRPQGLGPHGPGPQGPGAQPGWSPPPKPGLIPLRPLGFGTLIGAPFQELRRNPRGVLGSALLIQGILLIVSLAVVGIVGALAVGRITMADAADRDAVVSGAVASVLVSALVPVALGLVGSAFLEGIIVNDVARGTLGERLTLRSLWRLAGRRLWPLVGWALIVAGVLLGIIAVLGGIVAALVIGGGSARIAVGVIVGALGLIAVVVLGVWAYTKTSLVPCLIVLERRGIRASIRRSWSLTNGFFWRTFGVQFLVAVIVNVVSQVVTTPVSLVYGYLVTLIDPNGSGLIDGNAIAGAIISYAVLLLVSLVIGAVTTVVQASAIALIYIDLRMRKEGLDLHLVRFVESRQAGNTDVPDPYLATAAAASAPGPSAPPPPPGA